MNEDLMKMETEASAAPSAGPEKRRNMPDEWRKFAIYSLALTMAFGLVWFDQIGRAHV